MASLFSEALDFALTKAGKDSDFKLKLSLIFPHHLLGRPVTFLKNFLQTFVRRTFSQSGVTSICPICFSFSARFSFIPSYRNYWSHRSKPGSQKRSNAYSFINPRYTISSVFRDLLIPFKLITKISKSKKLFLPRIFLIGGARREDR